MGLFRKKNTYKITYQDVNDQLYIVLIEATTVAKACRKIERRYPFPWYVKQILEIEEIG